MAEDRIVFRLDPELRAKAQAAAAAEGRSLSNFTKRALEAALGSTGSTGSTLDVRGGVPAVGKPDPVSPRAPALLEPAVFHCPVPGCRFTAESPAAVCGPHGRRVVD